MAKQKRKIRNGKRVAAWIEWTGGAADASRATMHKGKFVTPGVFRTWKGRTKFNFSPDNAVLIARAMGVATDVALFRDKSS